jgi:hypothetical protein
VPLIIQFNTQNRLKKKDEGTIPIVLVLYSGRGDASTGSRSTRRKHLSLLS